MKKISKGLLALIIPSVVLFSACEYDDVEVDGDLDGYTAEEGDCNDSDASIHPAAVEVCDGVDQNCNGSVDEGISFAYYEDADGDGFGEVNSEVHYFCDGIVPEGYVLNDEDCNDMDDSTKNCHNCDEILWRVGFGTAANGIYNITPISGYTMSVSCQMTIDGGGWTQLTEEYLASLQITRSVRGYLYTNNNDAWYESPPTSYIWDWNTYRPVSGYYLYGSSGSTNSIGEFYCDDNETGYWGVGCSNGAGSNYKVFAHNKGGEVKKDIVNGTTTICQDQPDVFNVGSCAENTQIWVR